MFLTRHSLLLMSIISGVGLFNLSVGQAADNKIGNKTGDTKSIQQQIRDLQQSMQDQQLKHQAQIDDLQKHLDETIVASNQTSGAAQSSSSLLQIGLSATFAVGSSSVNNSTKLANLQAGGHDPNNIGFTVQNVELSIGSTVDPYLDAQTNIVFQINSAGETVVELEEAFFTTRDLPWGLQIKGGQYFTEFGRQNKKHPHTWDFVDQAVVLTRLLGGDGLRSQGVRASWLLPTDWYSEFYTGIQNAKGETASSFLSVSGDTVAGHTLRDRTAQNSGDLLYSARWLNGLDVSDTISMNIGVSGLWGPNASGTTTDTQIAGVDLYLKWQAATSHHGFPFVTWHTEFLKRRYEAGDPGDATREVLHDSGLFTQALWGFSPSWVAGLRWEYASAEGDTHTDPMRDTRKRLSPNITWYPTEYSKLRLQYNRDWTEHLADKTENSIWLQVEFNIGSHMAHTF